MKAHLLSLTDTIINIDISEQAFMLVKGEVIILKNDEPFIKVNPGHILGLEHMMKGLPSCHIKMHAKNAKIISLKRDQYPVTPL